MRSCSCNISFLHTEQHLSPYKSYEDGGLLPHNNNLQHVCVCVCVSDSEGLPPSDEGPESWTHRDHCQCPRPLQHRLCRGDPGREKHHCTMKIWQLCCAIFVFHTVLYLSQQTKYQIQTQKQQTDQVWYIVKLFCKYLTLDTVNELWFSCDRITVPVSLLQWASMSLWPTSCWLRRLKEWRRLSCAPTSWTRACLKAARYGMSTKCSHTVIGFWKDWFRPSKEKRAPNLNIPFTQHAGTPNIHYYYYY